MARLNDTKGLVDLALRSPSACPDGGTAMTARRSLPGALQFSYGDECGDVVATRRAGASAGVESLKGAMGALGKRVGG